MAKNERYLSSTKYWIETIPFNFSQIVQEYLDAKKDFLVYVFAERNAQGKSWCPDCDLDQPFVDNVLPRIMENESKKEVYFINIGVNINLKELYRIDKNVKPKRLPILIYFSEGEEMGRISESEMCCQETIDDFIDQIYEDL